MRWIDIKTAIEAQGVTDTSVISKLEMADGKPVLVKVDPANPARLIVEDTY